MKSLLASFILLPATLFAHSGHPGAEGHGDATHLLIGLAIALPIGFIILSLRTPKRKKAEVKVSRKD